MQIEIPDSEAGLLMYALRPFAFKKESKGLRQTADKLSYLIKEQIRKNIKG